MAEKTVVISQQNLKPIKILKWKVREGFSVSIGSLVLLYDFEKVDRKQQRKLKSPQAGTVCKLIAQEGAIIQPGEALFELEACIHPTVMKDMCAECGADLRKDDLNSTASVPMVHSVPELKVSEELAQKLGKADGERLLRDQKLVLLVDLDQTLIHTTNDIIPPNLRDVHHFQLYGPNSPWYHTRLRPGTHQFLFNMSSYFELHICTFGARNYAHKITGILDADGQFFSNRVLSRDECFNPTSKTANLKALFPCGDHMVCIIDDREDVWSHASNLIHVKPYHFFQHTGDINAPPGLEKHENDDKEGVDLTKIKGRPVEEEKVENKIDTKIKGRLVEQEKVENKIDTKIKGQPEEEKKVENKIDNDTLKTTSENKVNNVNVENTSSENEIKSNEDSSSDKQSSSTIEENNENRTANLNGDTEPIDKPEESKKITTEEESIKSTIEEESIKSTIEEGSIKSTTEEESSKSTIEEENSKSTIEEESSKSTIEVESNKTEANTEVQKENTSEPETCVNNEPENFIEIEDPDDYLLYLEDILRRIHKAFYEEYDKMESGEVPDLKKVIPAVKGQVLKGCKMIFSGLVPTHIKLEHSRAYQVARSLGAEVTPNFEDGSTHLVAVRPGTAKVNAGRRRKNLKIVTPDWLWACAERWEHVDEKIFPLSSKGSKNRHPPPHCSSPEHVPNYAVHETPTSRKRSPSGRFMDTINPLMSFSSDDIADMDKEVEDTLDTESESEDDVSKTMNITDESIKDREESSSSGESLTAEMPRGHKRSLKERNEEDYGEEDTRDSDEFPSTKFRRGEQLDSDLDIGQDSNSEGSAEAPDEIDDGEWNMMGAALEREFLSNS